MSGVVLSQNTTFCELEGGGVTSPQGFRAGSIHAGFKKEEGAADLAMVIADEPCATAGAFTKNVFCAAPVAVCREHLGEHSRGIAQAVVINAGNANAATGEPGLKVARDAAACAADLMGCSPQEVLVASTGVIGVQPPPLFEAGLTKLSALISREGGHAAAEAIMTTDTCPKECAVKWVSADPQYADIEFCVGGMTKGSGMIMPDMATMIAVLTTDVPFKPELLHQALISTIDKSFNKVTIDSDTSTNDCCFIMASGKAVGDKTSQIATAHSIIYQEFSTALDRVSIALARGIAADGEGATKLITVTVEGAFDRDDADKAARSVANSPLVKTAIFGHDANWGRVAMAIGKSGASFKQEEVSIDFMGMPVCREGLTVPFDEEEALRRFEASEIVIWIDLGAGKARATLWTCDYSHDYITINGDYRS